MRALLYTIGLTLIRAVTSMMKSLRMDTRPYRPEKHYMRGPGPKYREKWHAKEYPPAH